jgi:hypothetical protein
MKSDDRTRRIEVPDEHDENNHVEHEVETDPAEVRDLEPTGWVAQLRQLMQRSTQGEARTNIKRQQLKEDRTKSFLLLAGLTIVLSLAFFAMFSTPNGRKDMARSTHPNLGRGSGGENPDTGRSVTPLLAPTRGGPTTTQAASVRRTSTILPSSARWRRRVLRLGLLRKRRLRFPVRSRRITP